MTPSTATELAPARPTEAAERAPRPSIERVRQLPRVNLLPPEIAVRARLRRAQVRMGAALSASLLAILALHQAAASSARSASHDLELAEAHGVVLIAQQRSYSDVPKVDAELSRAKANLQTAMGSEIRWSLVLDDLSRLVPAGVWLTSTQFVQAAATAPSMTAPTTPGSATPTTPASPTTPTSPTMPAIASSLGTVSFTGSAASKAAVATWLEAMAEVPGFANPYVTSISDTPQATGNGAVAFTSTVSITDKALSNRYVVSKGAGQ